MIKYGAMQGECVDKVSNVNWKSKPLFSKKEYRKMVWVGRVNDPPRQMWVEYMKKMDPMFKDNGDPTKGPQPMNWKWYVGEGLEEWDGQFDEETIIMHYKKRVYFCQLLLTDFPPL